MHAEHHAMVVRHVDTPIRAIRGDGPLRGDARSGVSAIDVAPRSILVSDINFGRSIKKKVCAPVVSHVREF